MTSASSKSITAALASACGTILLVPALAGANSLDRADGCARATKGTNAGERLTGTGKGELLRGRGGADAIRGQAGDDCAYGGQGGDVIDAGHGADRFHGGRGDDRILARDGERDVVSCGLGRDDATVDHHDVVRGENSCERVERPDPAPEPEPEPQPDPGPDLEPDPNAAHRLASFESSLNAGTDFGWRCDAPFSCTRTSEGGATDGSHAAKIVTNGGNSSCSCPRMTFQDGFSLGAGDEAWIGGSWRLPSTREVAWSRLMNLGSWIDGSSSNWHLQFESTEPGSFQIGYAPYHGEKVKLLSVTPPEGRWFSLDLHLKLSKTDGQALTEVYLDGEKVGATTKANMWNQGGPLNFYNAGLSYFWPGNGDTTVFFDAPRLAG